VEPSGAVCGHSPKRRGLPNAELTRKCGDLYVLIAQRHPKHCSITASANGVVNLADMRWLHELGRDLQKVAINRDGVWHLKASVSKKMPRHGTSTRYKRYGCTCSAQSRLTPAA